MLTGCLYSEKSIEIIGPSTVDVNQTIQFEVVTKPTYFNDLILWSSSNDEVAIVDEEGNVTGLVGGIVYIYAHAESNEKIRDWIEVTITQPTITEVEIIGNEEIYLYTNVSFQAKVIPLHANQEVIWSSSDESIASIDDNGVVSALSIGETEIIAKSKTNQSVQSSYNIKVINPQIDEIRITGNHKLEPNETGILKAYFNNIEIDDLVIWSSSNPEVATVSDSGIVEALTEGEVTITAELKTNTDVYAEFIITVEQSNMEYYQSKVLVIDKNNQRLELLNCPATEFNENTLFLKKNGEQITQTTIDELYLGMENVYVEVDRQTNIISQILIDGDKGFSNIRVAIRFSIADISIEETIYHDSINFTTLENIRLREFDSNEYVDIPHSTDLIISYSASKMVVRIGSTVIFRSSNRIIFETSSLNESFMITSIIRNGDRSYPGNLEVSIVNGRLLLINDVNLEKYLYRVVPSEMPASYHSEALKAQAIAARTYAYMDILRRTTEHYGYTVDDSVKSQVYNNQHPHPNTNAAVDATQGLVMMNNGEPISAFYSSTSSGLTASGHEVWIENEVIEPIPYLIGQNLTQDESGNPISFNYQDEASMLAFFKRIKMTTPDSSVNHHRWRVTFTKAQLTNTINTNLKLSYNSYPNSILTETDNGWESLPIPSSIGEVNNIYVGQRGTSGVVVSLIVETTSGTYKIINQYNIRFTIRPKDAGTDVLRYYANGSQTTYSGSVRNDSILLSGFFAIEATSNAFTFYGGGNGHGVGMSQNGANGLGKLGYDYQEILTTYYSAIDLVDVTYNYQSIIDYKNYFN